MALLERARSRGLGLSTFVSAGNRADVSGNDLLQYWATDPGTEVVLLYLESFGNPRKFARLARAVGRTKPVVAVKSGRHVKRHARAGRHLGRGPGAVGGRAVRLRRRDPGRDRGPAVRRRHAAGPPAAAGRASGSAIVGNSTAIGVLVADAVLEQGLELAHEEPVDIGAERHARGLPRRPAGGGRRRRRRRGRRGLPAAADGRARRSSARRCARSPQGSAKPIVASFLSTEGIPPELAVLDEHGMPARGLGAVVLARRSGRSSRWPRSPSTPAGGAVRSASCPSCPTSTRTPARRRARRARADAGRAGSSTDDELIALLARLRHPAAAAPARSPTPTRPSPPRPGGRLPGRAQVDRAVAAAPARTSAACGWTWPTPTRCAPAFGAIPSGDPVIVQEMAAPGVATVVEIVDDPSFGALVSFGLGGVATDLLGDRAYRTLPLTDLDAAELVRAPRAWPLLDGYRGSEPVDVAALEDLLLRVARLADDLPEVLRLRLEPVIVGPGRPVARRPVAGRRRRHGARSGRPTARVDPGPRRMRSPGLRRREPATSRVTGSRLGRLAQAR